jgi:3',5'-cyclic-AMP phosphodiesterase
MSCLRILQISDHHLLEPGTPAAAPAQQRLERVLAWIAAGPLPHAVLATGDIADTADPLAYAFFADCLARLRIPALALPGNHDDPAALATHVGSSPVHEPRIWRFGNWAVCLLDSQREGECGGRLGPERLAALQRKLEREPAPHWLVAVHHPPVAVGSPWMDAMGLADGPALLDTLAADGRARAVVWGHIHQPFEARQGGMRLLACPATRLQFARRSREYAVADTRPGLRWLDLASDGSVETGVIWLPDEDLAAALPGPG